MEIEKYNTLLHIIMKIIYAICYENKSVPRVLLMHSWALHPINFWDPLAFNLHSLIQFLEVFSCGKI